MSAEDRRQAIVAAAVREFADKGFEGTSTEAIARRGGVSQPYLFQLFGTKRDLFIATVRMAFERTRRAFEAVLGDPAVAGSGEAVLAAMGRVYCDLLRDRDLLQCQLQAYAACAEPEIRAAVRAEFRQLYRMIADASGADPATLDQWFAHGMLMNTVAAMAPELAEDGENLSLAALEPAPPRRVRREAPAAAPGPTRSRSGQGAPSPLASAAAPTGTRAPKRRGGAT